MTQIKVPKVTLVIVPRERFSYTQTSLDSIYLNTQYPFELIYVDGNSPAPVRDYLQEASQKHGFKLIRTEHYLSPNTARNIAIPHVETEYLVFVDNDVLVQPGWLEALVTCGDRTGASVIAPITFEGEAFDTIHQAGGEIIFRNNKDGRQWMIERRPNMHLPLVKLSEPLTVGPTQLTEFHCVFARRDIFDKIGLLDEKLLSMAEETDFCLSVMNTGGTIYLEPASQVTYVPPFTLTPSDLPYFFLRWSDAWCETSVEHMAQKYELSPDSPVLKHYREFVYSHRSLAFGSHELSLKPLLLSGKISIYAKGKYFAKKILRHYMNQRASHLQYSAKAA